MIRLACPTCGKKLAAPDEHAGRMGKCPGCGQPIRIATEAAAFGPSIPLDETEPDQHVLPPNEQRLPVYRPPERLDRESHYLICDKTHLVAAWENYGLGWQFNTGTGMAPAGRHRDKLPMVGEFQLVELRLEMTPDGKRLKGIVCYRLADRWALNALDQGDDVILEKVVGPGCLNREQKFAVRQVLKTQFMSAVWQEAKAVNDFLVNNDFHSHGTM